MTRYKITITRTSTVVSTASTEIGLPTDDIEFARRYAETMMHPSMRYGSNGIRPSFHHHGEEVEALEVVATPIANDSDDDLIASPAPAVEPVDDDEVVF